MRFILLLTSIIFIGTFNLDAQDVIVKLSGQKINCKITNEDSVNVFLNKIYDDNIISTSIPKSEISKIIYDTCLYSNIITFENNGMSYNYFINDKQLKGNDVLYVLSTNKLAFDKYKESNGTKSFANLFSFAGGFLIGYPIGTYLIKGEGNWVLAGVGVGLVIISFPLHFLSGDQSREAIELYIKGLKKAR